jgi:hypothetical protein
MSPRQERLGSEEPVRSGRGEVTGNSENVDGAPEIHLVSINPDKHLIEMPAAMRCGSASPQSTRNTWSKDVDPAPDGFVGDLNAALCQEILDVAIAECEAEIHPNGALDNIDREAIATIRRRGRPHLLRRRFPTGKSAEVTSPRRRRSDRCSC